MGIGQHQFGFEKLVVWQLSRELTKKVYQITNNFPENEKFGLVQQLRRASISVASNIAEGSGRTSTKDQAHFYQLSYSSLMEVINQLIISHDLMYISDNELNEIRIAISEIANKINSLRKSTFNH
jgi:four helix bundle protein